MFGTRTVRHAVWTNGKRKVTGVWEYSGILDKYDIWLDAKIGDSDSHIIVDGAKEKPEWKGWWLVVPPPEITPQEEFEKELDNILQRAKRGT